MCVERNIEAGNIDSHSSLLFDKRVGSKRQQASLSLPPSSDLRIHVLLKFPGKFIIVYRARKFLNIRLFKGFMNKNRIMKFQGLGHIV